MAGESKAASDVDLSLAPAAARGAVVRWSLLATTGIALLACALVLGHDLVPLSLWTWIAISASTVGGLLVVATATVWRPVHVPGWWLVAVLTLGAAFRLAAMPARQFLSDDAFRYHWDGKVLWHGVNPYRYAPNAQALHFLRVDALDTLLVRTELRTVYPPLAELYFALGYALTPGRLTGIQALMLLSEIATWLLLLREIGRRGLPRSYLLLMAWSPLLLFQGYLPGHVDMLMVPYVALFAMALERGSPTATGLALALACLVKPHAVIFAPAAVRRLGLRRGSVFLAILGAVVGAGYAAFFGPGPEIFSSVALMAQQWSFNGSLAALLRTVLTRDATRLVAGALLTVLLLASAWRGRDNTARLLMAVTAFVVCTPNLFPWYLFLMLPLLVLRPDPPLLLLSVLIPITETVTLDFRLSGVWQQPLWQKLVEYVPFYLLLGISAWRRFGMFGRGEAR